MTFYFKTVFLKHSTILLLVSSWKTDTTNTFLLTGFKQLGKIFFLSYHTMTQFIDSVPKNFLCNTELS